MASLRSCSFICSVWVLLSFLSAMKTEKCIELNQTETIHQGMPTTINCLYGTNRSDRLTASLKRNHLLCEYVYLNKSWTKRFCNDNIRFVWIPETEEISFQLLNIHMNNTGIYTCTVVNYFPPPTSCLGEKRISIHVNAPPSVSVSCVKGPDGAPTVLCASEGFYPADLKQAWFRDGEYISYLNASLRPLYKENVISSDISWNYSKNTDGSYRVTSYLHLSSNITVYYCWVNHSTLSQPIIVNISSTECTEREEKLTETRRYSRSPVEAPPLPEPVSHSTLGTMGNHQPVPEVYSTLGNNGPVLQVYSTLGNDGPVLQVYSTLGNDWPVPQVYSTLGNHKPVPCRNNSNDTTSISL
ncbi:uncharacterized protein LOC128620439 isoform X2 [Ictalurus furcatus]|uniref:uncharacterized protein LOC128620439 isoform X2 n=1 Tax=Ictalurus furcatus TaxID=66913 RepID=UPI00235045C9|nr:uncharacterized protein LOC128620439 isoform X2 [Ictalurus furcatus]